jgi:flagellar P-ring protein precursor FlgI
MTLWGTFLLFACFTVEASRIKDITSIAGVRSNPLIGYGLVVGLDGSGDTETFTKQSFITMLNQLGVTLPPGIQPSGKNFAAVVLHAELPAFAKPGQTIDVTVSSVGNSKSLRGGTLLMAPLKGANGEIYAIAQGNLVVGGFGFGGQDGSNIKMNVPSVGRIPNGAMIERTVASSFSNGEILTFNLNNPDFTTARTVAEKINEFVGPGVAKAIDSTSVQVRAPLETPERVAFVSALENLELQVAQGRARIIVNSRTGTVIIGQNVIVSPTAISHGSLTVTINETLQVSQPKAPVIGNAAGSTVVTPSSAISVNQEKKPMFLFNPGVALETVVFAVNQVGVSPEDLVAILDGLRQVGALQADLEVI